MNEEDDDDNLFDDDWTWNLDSRKPGKYDVVYSCVTDCLLFDFS